MSAWENIVSVSSQMTGWCSCHIRPDTTLKNMNIVDQSLANFVNRLQERFNIMIMPEVFSSWIKLEDVNNYINSVTS